MITTRSATRCAAAAPPRIEAQVEAAPARTPEEQYEAAVLLARVVCDAGGHRAELEQARRLTLLAPWRRISPLVLWPAARHNGLQPLARQANAALRALADTPDERAERK